VDRVESEYPIYCGPVLADSGRIDILAEGKWEEAKNGASWVLVVEAKIDAEENDEQLSLYDHWLGRYPKATEIVRIFVTPEGRESESSSADWRALSFLDLASVFRRVSDLQGKPGYHFLRYYLTGVLRDVCELPVPISADCNNPYRAVAYLRSLLGARETEDCRGQSR
jgi:hypothetical protein